MTEYLKLEPRLADPDAFFARLVAVQRDLDAEGSARFSAKLLLLLANHIGDEAVLDEAIDIAKGTTESSRA